MNNILSIAFLFFYVQSLQAQPETISESLFKFNTRYSICENKWVVFPKGENGKYSLGFIYIDDQAGFTFEYTKDFKIENGNIIQDTTKPYSIKYRLQRETKDVCILPESLFAKLNIEKVPDWLEHYQSYTDTFDHNLRMGFIYNDVGESALALPYLDIAYKIKPHAPQMEFELIFAYNALARYDDAIRVINSAIQNKPDEVMFYRELGYAYMKMGNIDNAVTTYEKGIDMCPKDNPGAKSEMAINLADIYKKANNMQLYKSWGEKAKKWAPKDSDIYKHVTSLGFQDAFIIDCLDADKKGYNSIIYTIGASFFTIQQGSKGFEYEGLNCRLLEIAIFLILLFFVVGGLVDFIKFIRRLF